MKKSLELLEIYVLMCYNRVIKKTEREKCLQRVCL